MAADVTYNCWNECWLELSGQQVMPIQSLSKQRNKYTLHRQTQQKETNHRWLVDQG